MNTLATQPDLLQNFLTTLIYKLYYIINGASKK